MILASFRHATRSVLAREIPDEELVAACGGATIHDQMRTFDEHRVDALVRAYREHNEPLHGELQTCGGVLDAVETLRAEGRRLGIVTAKRHATVRLAFDVIPELERHFDVVVASDDTERHKPHPEPLLAALARLDASPAGAAYVGDSPFDVQAAHAAGLFPVAVAWGGIHSAERLADERPGALVHSAEELLAVL